MVGFASVGYIPNKRLAGLSKLARAVQYFSHELQTQERITRQTAMFLQERLNPIGVGVWIKAEHSCLSIRGVRAPGTLTTTVYLIGAMKEDPKTREEFLRAASS
jgi:GTP cyclohydrolase I